MDDLPESLLMEVLVRLPLVALHRFKVLCTKWLSLTSTPYFLAKYKSYASRGSISPCWAFVSRRHYHCSERPDPVEAHELLMDLHSGDLKCPIPNRSNNKSCYRIMGVNNGLVLYKWWTSGSRNGEHRPNWGVCNPVTRQYVVLSQSTSEHRRRDVRGLLTRTKEGVVTSFTVVRHVVTLSKFEVFSSETGEWELSLANNHGFVFLHRTPTDLGGILHWIICSSYLDRIVAFDPCYPGMLRRWVRGHLARWEPSIIPGDGPGVVL
ncbi:putative F-box protein At3g28280 [Henckelia pumila]|uniref:putative F-box protein At3g28280 n=1 Tax=Henckelia pumila TaxID=405737 RepID=UPI003C6DB96B